MKRFLQLSVLFILVCGLVIGALGALAIVMIYPTLPSLEALTDYRPKLPMRVYSSEGDLIAEFGEERRAFVAIEKIPKDMKDAVLAIEDRRFYTHNGIDTTGVLRAIKNNVTGKSHEGASTITMQVAKNFFTAPGVKRNLITKVKETLLALKIEKALKKDQILELYLNQIYLGQRAYGFAAAAQVYFGKPVENLTLAESALLAALPKAPSSYNPYVNPKRAIARQHEVLRDMQRFGFINQAQHDQALEQTLKFKKSKQSRDLQADYVAEVVRQMLYDRYGDEIYSSGMKVYTTIKKVNQLAANQAVLQGILDYENRQGNFAPEKTVKLSDYQGTAKKDVLDVVLDDFEEYSGFVPAIVTDLTAKSVSVHTKNGDNLELAGDAIASVKKMLADKDTSLRKIKIGSIVRVLKVKGNWHLVKLPTVESALVALNPSTGAVNALVGGFDFNKNKFNHATQALRQPGSCFKPFIYSAALEKGFTPATIVQDAPLSFSAGDIGSTESWEPQNFDEKFAGPMRLRSALVKSKNMVSIRVLQKIGPKYAQNYITKFGFSAKDHPAYLAMALGAGQSTPWQMAQGYAVFANGGYKVEPYIIAKIVDNKGNIIEEAKPLIAKKGAPRVIDVRNAFLMTSMMQDVVNYGTAKKALVLGRKDLAGKTGTTNNQVDAWFAGYNPTQVTVTWVGYDQPKSLGKDETGGKVALPIWIKYMGATLKGVPDYTYNVPEGIMQVKVDAHNGTLAYEDEPGIYEYFYHETPPPAATVELPPMEEPDESIFMPADGFPTSNPLQPEPPTIIEPAKESAPKEAPSAAPSNPPSTPKDNTDASAAAARVLNPQ